MNGTAAMRSVGCSSDEWRSWRGDDRALVSALSQGRAAHKYPAGVELITQSEPSREVLLLHEGIVKLVYVDDVGHELILGLRFGQAVLGVETALSRNPAVASALTLTSCVIESLAVERFVECIQGRSELMWAVVQLQARDVMEQMGQAVDIACYSSRARLAQLLTRMARAEKQPALNRVKLTMPLKRGELASLIGVTPEHFSRLFRQFQDEGVISLDKGWIVLQNLPQLDAEVRRTRAGSAA